MKVLLINGSSHKEGNTYHALSMAAKTLESQGIETEIMQIGNKPVRGCIACGVCKQKGNNRCTFDDDVCNRFLEKAKDADGFIFGSPTYYGQPNGSIGTWSTDRSPVRRSSTRKECRRCARWPTTWRGC